MLKIKARFANAAFFSVSHQSNNTKLKKKLHVNGVEVMHSDIDSLTTGQVRIKDHLSAFLCRNALKIASLFNQHTQHNH